MEQCGGQEEGWYVDDSWNVSICQPQYTHSYYTVDIYVYLGLLLGMVPGRGTWALILLLKGWLGMGCRECEMFSSDLDLSAATRGVWGEARPMGSCCSGVMLGGACCGGSRGVGEWTRGLV